MRRTVRLIAAKELLDTLRDRRTLFVALVLPLILYPALLIGLTQIIGVAQRNLADEEQKVLFDAAGDGAGLAERLRAQNLEPVRAQEADAGLLEQLRADVDATTTDGTDDQALGRLRAALDRHGYAGVLLCDPRFGDNLARNLQARASFLYDPTDEASKVARNKVRQALHVFAEEQRNGLHEKFPDQSDKFTFAERPVQVVERQVATLGQKGAYSFAPMLGILIIMMALTGAFYPAVDLAAGEKERGTLETLLVAPVSRTEIVLGKFVAVWVLAMVTALLNLVVMGVTFSKVAGMLGTGRISFDLPPLTLLGVSMILIPSSALFSAVALALSSFATSYKEGQHYMSPLFIVATPLAMVALLPNMEIGYALAFVPVANVVLLVKAMLLGGEAMGPATVATLATAAYAAVALFAAVSVFRRESVLFRAGAGKGFDAKSLQASRDGVPAPGAAVFLFFVVVAVMFFLSGNVASAADAVRAFVLAQAAALLPTIAFARRFRVDVRRTFSVRPLPLARVPLVLATALGTLLTVLALYQWLPVPEAKGFEQVIAKVAALPAWVLLLLLAVLPPICEEILCRGFLLGAFRGKYGDRTAILLSAALFGALHLDVGRFPATFLAGLALGYVCVRTGSILAPILFHMAYNGVLASTMLGAGAWVENVGAWGLAPGAILLAACLFLWERGRRATLTTADTDIHSPV